MPIPLVCTCGKSYSVRDEFAGQPLGCACGQTLIVPAPAPPVIPYPLEHEPPLSATPTLDFHQEPPVVVAGRTGPLLVLVGVLFVLAGGAVAVVLNLDAIKQAFQGQPQARLEAKPEPAATTQKQEKPAATPLARPVEPPKPEPPKRPPEPPPPEPAAGPFVGHTSAVLRVGFSGDGTHVLTASGGVREDEKTMRPALDSSLRLWRGDGTPVKKFTNFPNGISGAAFAPDGRHALLAGAGKGTLAAWTPGSDLDLYLWDLEAGRELRTLSGHLREPLCLAVSPDSKRGLSGGKDKVIRMWELQTGKEKQNLVGHSNSVNSVAFTSDGQRALSGSSDTTVRLWNLDSGKELKQLGGHEDIVWAVAVSPDDRLALSAGGYQQAESGRGLTQGKKDFAIRLWDLAQGEELRRFVGHTEAVSTVAFSADGRRVLSSGLDKTVRLWLTATGKQLRSFTGHKSAVHCVVFSPDGRRALSGGDDGMRVWTLPGPPTELVKALRAGGEAAALSGLVDDLAQYGDEVREIVPDLLKLLPRDHDGLRKSILAALPQLGKLQAGHVAGLTPLLEAKLPLEVRKYGLESLTRLGAEALAAVSNLVALLKDESAEVRVLAAKALGAVGKAGRATAQPKLIEALRDPDETVSTAARAAVAQIGPPVATELGMYRTLLADQSAPVRRFAVDALLQLKEAAEPASADLSKAALEDALPDVRRRALQALAAAAPRAENAPMVFRKALADVDVTVARQAVVALATLPPELSLEGLLAAVEKKDEELVKTAGDALDKINWDKSQAKKLGEVLQTAGPAGRTRLLGAVASLGAGGADALPALRELIKKAEGDERLALVTTLAKMGPAAKEAGPDLLPWLKRDPKENVSPLALETAYALLEMGAADLGKGEPIAVMVSALRITDEQESTLQRREKAMQTLIKLGKAALPALVKSLDGEFGVGLANTPQFVVRAVARAKVVEVLAALGPKVANTNEVQIALSQAERKEPVIELRALIRTTRGALQKKE